MSPRPRKPRNCACPYWERAFKPTGKPMFELEKIPLAEDELEALRLCDLLGMTQQEAGAKMGVSRGTVQRIVNAARTKVARALVNGCAIVMGAEPSRLER
jgi:uncharacterized protein